MFWLAAALKAKMAKGPGGSTQNAAADSKIAGAAQENDMSQGNASFAFTNPLTGGDHRQEMMDLWSKLENPEH